MTPEQQAELNLHLKAIANILYEQAQSNKLETLVSIEETIREQTLEYITPQIGFFLFKRLQELKQEEQESSKVLLVNYLLPKNKPSD